MPLKTKPPTIPDHYIALDDVRLWESNYNEGDVGSIVIMIRRYGFNRAVSLWRDNEVRAGNHTVMALRALQQAGEPAPKHVLEQDGKWYIPFIDVAHLNETEALAYAIADNRAAALASQDDALLAKYLQAIKNDDDTAFEAVGYDDEDLRKLFARAHAPMFPEGGLPGESEFSDEDAPITFPESTVRMVHLFLDTSTIDEFNAHIEALMVEYGVDNVTDVVREAVLRAYTDLAKSLDG